MACPPNRKNWKFPPPRISHCKRGDKEKTVCFLSIALKFKALSREERTSCCEWNRFTPPHGFTLWMKQATFLFVQSCHWCKTINLETRALVMKSASRSSLFFHRRETHLGSSNRRSESRRELESSSWLTSSRQSPWWPSSTHRHRAYRPDMPEWKRAATKKRNI